MKIRFSIRSVLLCTTVIAALAAGFGIILNELGPTAAGIGLLYFCVFFFVAILLYGRTMFRNAKSFWAVWQEMAPKSNSVPSELKSKRQHPLD